MKNSNGKSIGEQIEVWCLSFGFFGKSIRQFE